MLPGGIPAAVPVELREDVQPFTCRVAANPHERSLDAERLPSLRSYDRLNIS
jgi:hypothetical protein